MEKILIICDYCGKEVEIRRNQLPSDWFAIAYRKGSFLDKNDWRETHHFCSSKCMDGAVQIKRVVTPKEG